MRIETELYLLGFTTEENASDLLIPMQSYKTFSYSQNKQMKKAL